MTADGSDAEDDGTLTANEEGPLDPDDMAGIVELFGALDRNELRQAASELLYRRGHDPESFPIDESIEEAIDAYALLVAPGCADPAPEGDPIVAGPSGFPTIPERAEDLPHILDIDRRSIDRERVGTAASERYQSDVARAIEATDEESIERLIDLGYEIESWAPVELDSERQRLVDSVEGPD